MKNRRKLGANCFIAAFFFSFLITGLCVVNRLHCFSVQILFSETERQRKKNNAGRVSELYYGKLLAVFLSSF